MRYGVVFVMFVRGIYIRFGNGGGIFRKIGTVCLRGYDWGDCWGKLNLLLVGL